MKADKFLAVIKTIEVLHNTKLLKKNRFKEFTELDLLYECLLSKLLNLRKLEQFGLLSVLLKHIC